MAFLILNYLDTRSTERTRDVHRTTGRVSARDNVVGTIHPIHPGIPIRHVCPNALCGTTRRDIDTTCHHVGIRGDCRAVGGIHQSLGRTGMAIVCYTKLFWPSGNLHFYLPLCPFVDWFVHYASHVLTRGSWFVDPSKTIRVEEEE